MGIITKESGKKIKQTDMAFSSILGTGLGTKGIGKTICSTVPVSRSTVMVIDMKGCSDKAKETDKGLTSIRQVKFTRANGKMVR